MKTIWQTYRLFVDAKDNDESPWALQPYADIPDRIQWHGWGDHRDHGLEAILETATPHFSLTAEQSAFWVRALLEQGRPVYWIVEPCRNTELPRKLPD